MLSISQPLPQRWNTLLWKDVQFILLKTYFDRLNGQQETDYIHLDSLNLWSEIFSSCRDKRRIDKHMDGDSAQSLLILWWLHDVMILYETLSKKKQYFDSFINSSSILPTLSHLQQSMISSPCSINTETWKIHQGGTDPTALKVEFWCY